MKIFAQSPTRLGIIGGGTDVAPYSTTHGGACISMAINLRQRFTLYTKDNIHDIAGNKLGYNCSQDFVYAFREEYGINSMHHSKFETDYDDILESGIGSSAAAAVAMVGAISKSQGLILTRAEIAEKAWEVETKHLKLYGGKQDQYTSAFGGLNLFEFTDKVSVQPFDRKYADQIVSSFVLLHTGIRRKSSIIQENFKELSLHRKLCLDRIKDLVIPMVKAIGESDIISLGRILDESWKLKKQSNNGTTNTELDGIYKRAKKLGAIGAKACGAGGGGFMFFIVPQEKQANFIEKMGLEWFDFSADYNGLEVKTLMQ